MSGVPFAALAVLLAALGAAQVRAGSGGRRARRLARRSTLAAPGRRVSGWRVSGWRVRSAASPTLGADDVALLAERLSALSRAGLPAGRSWSVLAARGDRCAAVCDVVVRTVALGGTPADGLRAAAPQGGPVSWLSVAFAASQVAGAPLAEVLDGVAVALRADAQARRERDTALAGPRATATVLLWLPVAGIGLGLLTGANPAAALIGTPAGRGCLVVGGALWGGGRWWMARLVRVAERAGALG